MLARGLVVSTSYRGAADAMPTGTGIGPFWTESSRGMIRFTFAFFALWGLAVFIAGIVKLV
jgi:hypothetical protein